MNEIEEMLQVNKEQASFYDSISIGDDKQEQTGYATNRKANLLTRAWAALRYRQQQAFTESGLEIEKDRFQQGILESKKDGVFLEIGCFRGTRSSWPLIEHSRKYIGIDLSANAIYFLNGKIEQAGMQHKANAIAGDFLNFGEEQKFDLIFAHGVLHHFKNPGPLFDKISALLKQDGVLLLTEPSEVNLLYSVLRKLYRPFQSDAAWEWPFNKSTLKNLEKHLKPIDGFGWGRYSLLLSMLTGVPLLNRIAKPLYISTLKGEIRRGWHSAVWLNSTVTAAYQKKEIG